MSLASPLTRLARFLHTGIDLANASLETGEWSERRLSELRGVFADDEEYERLVAAGDPVVYSVSTLAPGDSDGDLHVGLGRIMPGRVGREFFMTRGHIHFWRPAAEVYVGLAGKGVMVLQDEVSRETRVLPLEPNGVVYVPGHTAHRTVNAGGEELIYLGIYPARAGHDYGTIAERGFAIRIVAADGGGWRDVAA